MVEICILEYVVDSILTYSKSMHPREAILLLKGKMDILDMHILGTVHSHPSGALVPSLTDLNMLYGGLMIICSYPYSGMDCMKAYDAKGREIPLRICKSV